MNKKIENRQTFLNRLQGHFSQTDINLIEFAYDLSKEAHRTQKRDQGGRYFEHPRSGCLIILDELGVYDRDILIAFLLHDTGEDNPIFGNRKSSYSNFIKTATFRLSMIFGEKVSNLVIKMTKPEVDGTCFKNKKDAFNFYTKNLEKEPEAMFLKMVDRLHNLRTSDTETIARLEKSMRVLKETLVVYLPLFKSVLLTKKMSSSKEKLLIEIRKECKRLTIETGEEKVKKMLESETKKWDEISELCEPWN